MAWLFPLAMTLSRPLVLPTVIAALSVGGVRHCKDRQQQHGQRRIVTLDFITEFSFVEQTGVNTRACKYRHPIENTTKAAKKLSNKRVLAAHLMLLWCHPSMSDRGKTARGSMAFWSWPGSFFLRGRRGGATGLPGAVGVAAPARGQQAGASHQASFFQDNPKMLWSGALGRPGGGLGFHQVAEKVGFIRLRRVYITGFYRKSGGRGAFGGCCRRCG